jgi:PAS domain S-box-containing protein
MQKWRETVHDRQAVDAEYRLRGKDGQYRWMSVHAVPLRTKDGQIVRWLGINIDIDDRKQQQLLQHSTDLSV